MDVRRGARTAKLLGSISLMKIIASRLSTVNPSAQPAPKDSLDSRSPATMEAMAKYSMLISRFQNRIAESNCSELPNNDNAVRPPLPAEPSRRWSRAESENKAASLPLNKALSDIKTAMGRSQAAYSEIKFNQPSPSRLRSFSKDTSNSLSAGIISAAIVKP